MGQSPEAANAVAVDVDATNSTKSKEGGQMLVIDDDDDVVRGSGCWFFRSFVGCLSKRSNADSAGVSGSSSQNGIH